MNEGVGNVVHDATGNNLDGTFVNMVDWADGRGLPLSCDPSMCGAF